MEERNGYTKARNWYRAVTDTAFAVAAATAFVVVWAAAGLSDAVRRGAAFAISLLFVVLFHEAARSWKRARQVHRRFP